MILYNDNDPFAVKWLRRLIETGQLPDGVVSGESIKELSTDDVGRHTQVHLFAGIGGWSRALHLAGWPNESPVWTGSCPCQPFSNAGNQLAEADPRHLWPEMRRLIAKCHPPTIFGEQVASKLGRQWLARVFDDLEEMGYACAGADLCAASVGAPHIRQRLWWVARLVDAGGVEWQRGESQQRSAIPSEAERHKEITDAQRSGTVSGLADASGERCDRFESAARKAGRDGAEDGSRVSGMGVAGRKGLQERVGIGYTESSADASTPWQAFELASCRDGKTRRIKPGLQLLAHGLPQRVGRLRGFGNAIVPQLAAEFIKAYMEVSQPPIGGYENA